MRNLWVQTEAPFVTWHADVTALLDKPDVLVDLTCSILEAGAEHDLVIPVEVPDVGFVQDDARPLPDVIRECWNDRGIVELFRPLRSARVQARLSWFDRHDKIVEQSTEDLAAVLTDLQPVPGAIRRTLLDGGYSPVAFDGWRLSYPDHRTLATKPIERATFGCALHSDIWFPYVRGLAHPKCDLDRWFDNRDLALRHTPRLNSFVERCAALVVGAGGRWYVEASESKRTVAPFVHDRGIHLDPPTPALASKEALDVVWEAVEVD